MRMMCPKQKVCSESLSPVIRERREEGAEEDGERRCSGGMKTGGNLMREQEREDDMRKFEDGLVEIVPMIETIFES